MQVVLSVKGARKSFGGRRALDGADLELRAGEWLGLLGPNGAGKTTLVRSIAGRVRLDGGEVDLVGSGRGAEAGASRRRLGIVPQEIALYPGLTAGENLRVFGALHGLGVEDCRARADWALSWTGLDQRTGEPVGGFSGGMKRRLNIACGVLHDPEIVLLDEPTAGVDPQSRQRIWAMLEELRRGGTSLLLTTHQLDEAQQVTDRIVILDHGRVIGSGTLDELVRATLGTGRSATFQLDREPPETLLASGFERAAERKLSCRLEDISADLPGRLAELAAAGCRILDLGVESPNLQSVFLHLTGRELRE